MFCNTDGEYSQKLEVSVLKKSFFNPGPHSRIKCFNLIQSESAESSDLPSPPEYFALNHVQIVVLTKRRVLTELLKEK